MRGEARLTEANTQEMLREIRIALLEADVALPVVRDFIAKVREKALGQEVLASLSPGQALVGVVHDELTALIGGTTAELNFATQPPAIILMAGLQGAGKTTTVGKLAKWLREQKKKKVLTVSCDVYRPAAIDQLKTVTAQAGADFFASSPDQKPLEIAQASVLWARNHYHDVVLVDTAGRLGIDQAMMAEIAALHSALKPIETLFVVDAMQGQDAVNTARAFKEAVPLTGVVLTKLDGDSRGGAALSVKAITGCPIKFVGTGEKLDGLDAFHPDRMANRILGMGDILALVEQAQASVDQEAARGLAEKLKGGSRFDLNDFLAQISQMKKMGGLSSMMDKLPAQMQAAAGQACRLMKVLANADRLMILCQLSLGEKRVGELEELLGIVQPTLSQQLTVLRDEELVSTRREGKAIYYQLSSPQALAVIQVLYGQFCSSKKE